MYYGYGYESPENLTWVFDDKKDIRLKKQDGSRYTTITCGESIKKILEKEVEKFKEKAKERVTELGDEIHKLKGELQTQEKAKDEEINKLQDKNKSLQIYCDKFKEYLIGDHLHSDMDTYGKENLKDILYLVELRKKDKKIVETQQVQTNSFPNEQQESDINPFSEEYIHSEKCVCGNHKFYGSKGCKECKMKADRIRKRKGLGMEEAWEEHWSSLGFHAHEDMEETY